MNAPFDAPGDLGPIGIDVGSRTIRAVQLRHTDAGPVVYGAAFADRIDPGRPFSAREAERLARILARRGFAGSDAVLAIPDDKLLCNTFEQAANASGPPVEIMARVELARAAGCAPTQLEAASWRLPAPARARQSTHVLTVGCLHNEANSLLDAVEAAGLRVRALEPRGCALRRACENHVAGRTGICAILDIGWTGALAALVYKAEIVYQRFIPEAGLRHAADALAEAIGLETELAEHIAAGRCGAPGPAQGGSRIGPVADAHRMLDDHLRRLAHEVGLSLSYASHWYAEPQIDAVFVTGEGARTPGARERLAADLGPETTVVSVGALFADELGACGPDGPALVTAAGLAAWTGDPIP